MSAVNSISATQFGSVPTQPNTSVGDVPRAMSGTPSTVLAPLPGMGSTMTSQERATAWRTNSGGGPMPLSQRTNGTTLRFDS
jgi:hypothetical protein